MIMLAFSRFRRSPSSRCPDASSASRQSFPIRRRSRCKRDCAAPATAWNAERRRSEPFTAQVMAAINDARPLAADDRAMIKASATALAEYFRHIPKIVVFRATVLIQFARLFPDRIQIQREGAISPRPSRRSARCPARRLRHAQHDVPSLPAGAAQGPARSRTQSHRVFAVNSSRGADPRPCRLRRHLRSERGPVLRQAADSLQSRRLFLCRGRRPQTRASSQRSQLDGCRGSRAVRACAVKRLMVAGRSTTGRGFSLAGHRRTRRAADLTSDSFRLAVNVHIGSRGP